MVSHPNSILPFSNARTPLWNIWRSRFTSDDGDDATAEAVNLLLLPATKSDLDRQSGEREMSHVHALVSRRRSVTHRCVSVRTHYYCPCVHTHTTGKETRPFSEGRKIPPSLFVRTYAHFAYVYTRRSLGGRRQTKMTLRRREEERGGRVIGFFGGGLVRYPPPPPPLPSSSTGEGEEATKRVLGTRRRGSRKFLLPSFLFQL